METRGEALRRAVRDTLDSIVSASVRDTLLRDALAAGGCTDIPVDAQSYVEFLDGPFRVVLERALGKELGRSVLAELERLTEPVTPRFVDAAEIAAARARARSSPAVREAWALSLASPLPPAPKPTLPDLPSAHARLNTLPAGTAPSDSPSASTPPSPAAAADPLARAPTWPAPPPGRWSEPRPPFSGDYPSGTAETLGMTVAESARPGSRRLPVVFIATRDPELVRRFAAWLDPRAAVVRVSRLVDLLLDLEDLGARRTVIVLDVQKPALKAEALAAVADELPSETRVVLWGSNREQHAQLCHISEMVARWIACPEQTPLAAVVERCAELVG